MNKRAKSSRKRMANRAKWGRGGYAQGNLSVPSPTTIGQVISEAIKNLFRRKV